MTSSGNGSQPVRISVVLTHWNTRPLLYEALTSLQQTGPRTGLEVIVVDNGSTDGAASMVASEFPGYLLIANKENLGYARANNQGIACAQGVYVLLLGSDTVMREGTVERLAAYLDAHPETGAVSCRLLNPDGSPQLSCRRFPRLRDAVATYLNLHALTGRYTMRGFDFGTTQVVEQPAATCLLVRRDLLRAIGGFDETYSILYTDVDLCRRISAAGRTIVYVADAEIVHYGSMTTSGAPGPVRLEMYRDILRYFARHHSRAARAILTPVLMLRLLAVTRSPLAFRLFSLRRERWTS